MLTRQPRVGERVRWEGWAVGRFAVVTSVEGNLCWISEHGQKSEPFIWRFRDGLNKLVEIDEVVVEATVSTVGPDGVVRQFHGAS